MRKETIFSIVVLIAVACISGVLFAIVYQVTKLTPEEIWARTEAVLTDIKSGQYQELSTDRFTETSGISGVYTSDNGLLIVQSEAKGYGGTIKILTAIDVKDEKIFQVKVLSHSETPGLGTKAFSDSENSIFAQLKNQPLAKFALKPMPDYVFIEGVSGATRSSNAVIECVNLAVRFYEANKTELTGGCSWTVE